MMRRFLMAALLAGGLATFGGPATAGTLVVISSSSPVIKAGTMIDGSKPLQLENGMSVTLVSADGRTLKLAGPYSGEPDPTPGTQRPELLKAISEMVSRPARNTSSGGIMRAGLYDPADPWVVHSEGSGWHCFREDMPLRLWRPMAVGEVQANLRSPMLGDGRVEWPDGGHDATWPEAVPLRDGATYRLRYPRSRRVHTFTMRVLPPNLENDAGRAAWMYRAGCLRQARALLKRLQG